MIFRFKDQDISYEDTGTGKPLLLLHGFLESKAMWHPLLDSLSDTFRVITVDLPGHGDSSVYSETHTMEFMSEVIFALIQQLDLKKIHIIGHSMGGYVALACLEQYSEYFTGITLLNSTTKADSKERLKTRTAALKIIPTKSDLFIETAIPNLFAESSRSKHKDTIKAYIKEALKMSTTGITAAIRGMMQRPDRSAVLRQFQGLKVWISGDEDPIMPVNQNVKLAKMTSATHYSVTGGHISVVESFDEIVKIVHFIE